MKSLPLLKKYSVRATKLEFESINDEMLKNITSDIGIYMFKNKRNNKIDYIGTATGQKGLKQRVKNQHLNQNYIKSVFRVKVSTEKKKDIKEESVTFIKRNYKLAILPIPEHVSVIMALEQVLIYEHMSKYNSESNKA